MRNKENKRTGLCYGVLMLSLLLMMLLGLICGSIRIPLNEVLRVMTGQDTVSKNAMIIWNIRLPRVLAGVLAGSGLASAGVILQCVMNNSLASPNTIGVNSGAGFFVMLSMVFFPYNLFMKSAMSFVGALLTSVIILFLAYSAEKSRSTIVLAGITVSSFLSAGMNMIKILDPDININAVNFMVGSLSGITTSSLIVPGMGIVITLIIVSIFSKALNILALGDGVAGSLGLNVHMFRIIFIVLSSILAGSVVSFCGLIGFVGLIVPHICRYFFGHDARRLMPAAVLMGAVFVLLADLAGRVLFAPFELPAGIILSLAGGPFFLYLLMRKGGKRVNA